MIFANLAGLIIKTLPLVIAIFALTGLALLLFCFFESKERIVMDAEDTAKVKVSDLWMELVRNRPLRILSFFFIISFATMSISNAADSYFMTYNIGATPFMMTVFMWLVTLIPAVLFAVAIFVIGKYELSDERMDEINMEIANRR